MEFLCILEVISRNRFGDLGWWPVQVVNGHDYDGFGGLRVDHIKYFAEHRRHLIKEGTKVLYYERQTKKPRRYRSAKGKRSLLIKTAVEGTSEWDKLMFAVTKNQNNETIRIR